MPARFVTTLLPILPRWYSQETPCLHAQYPKLWRLMSHVRCQPDQGLSTQACTRCRGNQGLYGDQLASLVRVVHCFKYASKPERRLSKTTALCTCAADAVSKLIMRYCRATSWRNLVGTTYCSLDTCKMWMFPAATLRQMQPTVLPPDTRRAAVCRARHNGC